MMMQDESLALISATQAGREAATRGLPADSCPHPVGSHKRYLWMFGYSSTSKPPAAIATDGEILALAEHHGLVWLGRGMAHSEAGVGQDIKPELLAFARDLIAGRASG